MDEFNVDKSTFAFLTHAFEVGTWAGWLLLVFFPGQWIILSLFLWPRNPAQGKLFPLKHKFCQSVGDLSLDL